MPLDLQPVQHAPPSQAPPGQGVPEGAGGVVQLPLLLQASAVQGSPSSQAVQAPPPFPHAAAVVPPWQALPFQHPVQHEPARHCPPLHAVPSGLVPPVHCPATHIPVAHSPVAWQVAQELPFTPQARFSLPDLHCVPSQQPAQPFCGQGTPQPSSAPAHLPAHSATQSHLPFGLQIPPFAQSPHFPPQPSLPQTLPVQSGVQPLQAPEAQVELFALQSTHGAPAAPHALFAAPVRQERRSALQQPGQLSGSHSHLTPTQRSPGPHGPHAESSGPAPPSRLLRPSGGR